MRQDLREALLEIAEQLDCRPTESIQGLIVIADNCERCTSLLDDGEVDSLLKRVRVLVFIDEQGPQITREALEPTLLETLKECFFKQGEVHTITTRHDLAIGVGALDHEMTSL